MNGTDLIIAFKGHPHTLAPIELTTALPEPWARLCCHFHISQANTLPCAPSSDDLPAPSLLTIRLPGVQSEFTYDALSAGV